jgi:hypothetical protein
LTTITLNSDCIKQWVIQLSEQLLITHAPPDEYDYETNEIFDTIQKNHKISANDLTNIIFRVFTNKFGSDTLTKDAEECQEIAEKILSSLV